MCRMIAWTTDISPSYLEIPVEKRLHEVRTAPLETIEEDSYHSLNYLETVRCRKIGDNRASNQRWSGGYRGASGTACGNLVSSLSCFSFLDLSFSIHLQTQSSFMVKKKLYRRLRNASRLYLKSNRLLYPILKRLRDPEAGAKLCRTGDHLCVEGYPSSGNSFAYNFLRILFPNLRMGHHSHSIANVKIARSNEIPAVVLLRNPYECISSRVVRFSEGADDRPFKNGINEYVWFFKTVEQILADDTQDLVQLLTFQTLVENPSTLACVVTSRVYPDSATRTDQEIQFASDLAQKCIDEWTLRQHQDQDEDGSLTVSIPSKERTRRKESAKDRLASFDAMERAMELYEALCEEHAVAALR